MLTLNIKIQLRKNYNIIMKVSMFLSMRPKVHLHAVVAKFLKKSKKSNIKRAKNCKRAREQEREQEQESKKNCKIIQIIIQQHWEGQSEKVVLFNSW